MEFASNCNAVVVDPVNVKVDVLIKEILGTNIPCVVDFISKIEEALGELVPIPT